MPIIPAQGSAFEKIKRPEQAKLQQMQEIIGKEIETMNHCRQCRSDAAGMLGKERVIESKCQSIKVKNFDSMTL